jgi:hypothetical protein
MESEKTAILSGPYRHLFPEIIDRHWDQFPETFRQRWSKGIARDGAYEFWCTPHKLHKGRLPYKTLEDMEYAFVAYMRFYRAKSKRSGLSERQFALENKRKEGDSAVREFQRQLRDVRMSTALWIRPELLKAVPVAFARLGPPKRAWREKIVRLVCHHIALNLEPFLENKFKLIAIEQIKDDLDQLDSNDVSEYLRSQAHPEVNNTKNKKTTV